MGASSPVAAATQSRISSTFGSRPRPSIRPEILASGRTWIGCCSTAAYSAFGYYHQSPVVPSLARGHWSVHRHRVDLQRLAVGDVGPRSEGRHQSPLEAPMNTLNVAGDTTHLDSWPPAAKAPLSSLAGQTRRQTSNCLSENRPRRGGQDILLPGHRKMSQSPPVLG